jgi:hypothetical protein
VLLTNPRALLLGDSLQDNSHVSELQLRISLLWEEGEDEDNDSFAPLLRFIGESQALLRVSLQGDIFYPNPVPASVLRRFFLAIAKNPTIEFLCLTELTLHAEGLDVLMKTAQSLKSLSVRYSCGFACVAARDKVAKALGENQTLERLDIEKDFVGPALLHLGSHPRLRELILYLCDNERPSHMDALACVLRSSTTLDLLNLWGYKFKKDHFEHFMKGIRSSPSLTKLTLKSCVFDKKSTLLFQHILDPKKDSTGIRELIFGSANQFRDDLSTGSVIVNILAPNQVGDEGTKTSQIKSLDLLDLTSSNNTDLALVCDALGANPTGIQLQWFRFGGINSAGCDALIRCLPKMLHLKHLVIESVVYGLSSDNLLWALRQNGCLQTVAVGPVDRTGQPLFNKRESRRLQSYCKRNEAIPTLLAKPQLNSEDSNMTDLFLFPTLFGVAKQAPAPNSMLIGLLGARDSVGPNSSRKAALVHTMRWH